MKLILRALLFVMLIFGVAISAEAQNRRFTIEVRITGLEEGDKLRFTKTILPIWDSEPGFDIVVRKPGYAKYKGTQEHTQLYSMRYFPKGKMNDDFARGGQPILIGSGTTKIKGERKCIYYSAVESALYDRQLQQMLTLEDSLRCIRSDIMKGMQLAQSDSNVVEVRRLYDVFNNFDQLHKTDYDRLEKMKQVYEQLPGGEYAASEILQKTYLPVENLRRTMHVSHPK